MAGVCRYVAALGVPCHVVTEFGLVFGLWTEKGEGKKEWEREETMSDFKWWQRERVRMPHNESLTGMK